MNSTIEATDTSPRGTFLRIEGASKGVVDGEVVGHGVLEEVGRKAMREVIGWKGIQWGTLLSNAAPL